MSNFFLQPEPTSSEEASKLKEDMAKLLEELQATRQERDLVQEQLDKTTAELTNAKEMIEIHNAQQQSVSEDSFISNKVGLNSGLVTYHYGLSLLLLLFLVPRFFP